MRTFAIHGRATASTSTIPCLVSGLTSESTVVSSTTAPMSRHAYEYETCTQNQGPCVTTYMAVPWIVWIAASDQIRPRPAPPSAAARVSAGTTNRSPSRQLVRVSLPVYRRLNSSQHGPMRTMPRYSDRAQRLLATSLVASSSPA